MTVWKDIEKRQTFLVIVAFLITGMALLYRAFYGMDLTDETFYLSTAKRFCDGDLLFMHDWNAGQIFGLLMVPFYRIYVFFHGNNEGVILSARIAFVGLGLFVSVFLYRILYRFSNMRWGALVSALCVFVYARGNIITISYYSLGFHTFLLAILWYAESEDSKHERLCLILSGISFSVSVLCMPYMVFVFVLLVAGAGWRMVQKKAEQNVPLYYFLAGIFLAALIFLMYFSNLIPWSRLMECLPMVFQDPSIEEETILEQLRTLFSYWIFVFLKYTWPFYFGAFLISFFAGKGWVKSPAFRKMIPWGFLLLFLIQSVYARTYFEGGVVVAVFLLALQMQFFSPEYRLRKLERCFILPGLLFGLVWIVGSNVGERAINMSLMLMNLWAIPFLWGLYREKKENVYVGIRCSACLMFLVLFVIRFFDIYRDGALSGLDCKISRGIMRGIHTEAYRARAYENTVRILSDRLDDGSVVIVLGCNPWVYLDAPASCGAYTTWQHSDGGDLLRQYYEYHPEKVPDMILAVPEEINCYESWTYSSHGSGTHREEQPVLEGILQQIVEEKEYVRMEEDGAVWYSPRYL